MSNKTTTSRGRRKRRGSETVDLRLKINHKRQIALWTNEHVDNSEILKSSGNKEDAKDIAELPSIRPKIDYSDLLVSSDDMTKDEWNTDFSDVMSEKIRQSMFVGDEILNFSDDNEESDPNVSNYNGNREILKRKEDGHNYRQVEENKISITSRMCNHVATTRRKNEHIQEQFDIKSIPLERVCDSTKYEKAEIDREIIKSNKMGEEEVYEDEYIQKQPFEDWSASRKYDHDAVGIKSMKNRQPEAKDEHGTNQWRDNEAQNVNKSSSYFLQPSDEKEVSARNVFQRSPRPWHRHHHNNKYSTTDPWTRQKINKFISDFLSQERCRVSNTLPSAKEYGDSQNNQITQHSFLGTLKDLSRPGLADDEIASLLGTIKDELSQYLHKEENCPKLSSLIDILVRCAECNVSTTSKRDVMYILKTSKFFERKDVIDTLKKIKMRTSPAKGSEDDRFLVGLLLVMKAMIDTVILEESDTTIARSLIESIINQRSEDVSLERQRTVLQAITESFERKGKKQEENGEFRGELFAETLPILPDIDIIRQVKETDIL